MCVCVCVCVCAKYRCNKIVGVDYVVTETKQSII